MFETAELGRKISKKEYEARVPQLRLKLLEAQRALKSADFPVLILMNGVDGAGKGDTANVLHEWMDPRYLQTYAVGPRTEEERQRPEFWRYWMAMPPRGRVGVFFGSWYTGPILGRVEGQDSDAEFDRTMTRINSFERALVLDGALIIKFWFHLSKDQQKRRFKRLEKDPKTRWRVTATDWRHAREYDRFRPVSERALRLTSTGKTPWIVVEGADARYRDITVAEHIIQRIARHVAERQAAQTVPPAPETAAPSIRASANGVVTILDTLDLHRSLDKKVYTKELEYWQGRLNRLSRKAQAKQLGAIMVFEGWDAGGKGGCIRRVTRALDARYYQIIPIAAPTDEEKARHYLWRFWRHLPPLGSLTIYDRSWYGRVLVERVEGFASREQWMRAYHEINDFEEQLVDHGIVLTKFWLHISRDEQKRRFEEREKLAWKRHKITEEDWRNREKWDEYEVIANDMIGQTSTEYAPWTLVEGDDKRYARIKVLKTQCAAMKRALERLSRAS